MDATSRCFGEGLVSPVSFRTSDITEVTMGCTTPLAVQRRGGRVRRAVAGLAVAAMLAAPAATLLTGSPAVTTGPSSHANPGDTWA
jgi:hypothetical protein